MIGSEVGHYRILAPLGAGGMGQVFRARDNRLKREVALKMLPEGLATDAQRLARLRREAELLASCSHPNVAAIHGLEEAGGALFLVLELVGGRTLAERLSSRPFGLEEALSAARQVASALEAAHQRGIVHRDLKPANVMLDESGRVKVLDFGLARPLARDAGGPPDPGDASTRAMPLTAEGVLVGTAPYMSPEQLRGEAVDARTDIWAFGCLLFELLSGRRAFQERTLAETAAAIQDLEPDWTALPAGTPPAIRRLLQRCLRKDPARRLHHAADVRIELEEADLAPPDQRSRRTREAWAWAVAALAVVAAVGAALLEGDGSGTAPGPLRFSVPLPPGLSILPGEVFNHLAISPDGGQLAFVASDGGLWVHSFADATSRKLPGADGAATPFWSPDSRFVGYFSGGELKKLPLSGGPPQVICRSNQQGGVAWGNDGTVLFSQASGGPPAIHAVPAQGGEPRAVTRVDPEKEIAHFWPQPLPGGERFLFVAIEKVDGGVARSLRAGSLAGGPVETLGGIDSRVQYVPPGLLLYVTEGTLVARRFDAERLALLGEPTPLSDRLRYLSTTGHGEFSASMDAGRPVVACHGGPWTTELVWFDRSGRTAGALGEAAAHGEVRISPSAHSVLGDVFDPRSGGRDLWLYDTSGAAPRRFTLGAADEAAGVWSPDGRTIAFRSDVRGPPDIYVRRSDGAGEPELLLSRPSVIQPLDWAADGRLLFRESARATGEGLWVATLAGERPATAFVDTDFDEWDARFSPDGKWIAFVSDESGRAEVYVAPASEAGARRPISREGGLSPLWRGDGRELFYLGPGGMVRSVAFGASGVDGSTHPTELFRLPRPVFGGAWDVTPDGKRFLVNLVREDSRQEPIRVILNWTELVDG